MEDGAKRGDLEDRTFQFAEAVRYFIKQLPRTLASTEDVATARASFRFRRGELD